MPRKSAGLVPSNKKAPAANESARKPAVKGAVAAAAEASSMHKLGAGVLLAVPLVVMLVVHKQLSGWALWTEDEVRSASVLHPLFNSAEHFCEAHWRPEGMLQGDRLDGITKAYDGAVEGLRRLGINAFLESSSLIGLLRHKGHMPWEVDGDVGMLESECRASRASKAALASVIGDDFEVLKFACKCEEDCEGDNKRMAGRVTHRGTGVVIDIFVYAPVVQLRPWQQTAKFAGREWWERVDDHADYTFPLDTLLPLRNGTFEGVEMKLPNKPREFLSWEYGQCLGSHVWPWRLLLYTPVPILVPGAIVAKGMVMLYAPKLPSGGANSPWLTVTVGAYAALSMGFFDNGVAMLMLMLAWVCELAAVVLVPDLLSAGSGQPTPEARAHRRRHRTSVLVALIVPIIGLGGCIGQLTCQIDDFYLHPLRPKTWTLCLFGTCWDF